NNTQPAAENEHKKLRKTFERAEVLRQWIEQIEKNNEDIRIYIKRIEDIKHNQKDVEEKLSSFFQNNTSIAHQISAKLKEVDDEKAFLDNNQLLENYRNIQKQIIRGQLQAKGVLQVTDEELTSLLDEGADIQIFTENILAETAEAKRILASVEERHQQLLQIERMLTEVRDMFVQMAILVDSQQELIDRIEYQTQTATDYIGAVDLGAVRRSKKKYLKRKIYFILVIVVL
ncbi:syntaxin-1A-like, partial [Asbolus verrucosus]